MSHRELPEALFKKKNNKKKEGRYHTRHQKCDRGRASDTESQQPHSVLLKT